MPINVSEHAFELIKGKWSGAGFKGFQLNSIMQTQRREGMVTLTQSFIDLYAKEVISADVLLAHAPDAARAQTFIRENPQSS